MTEFSTPLEAFLHWERTDPDRVFLKQPINRNYRTYTYGTAGIEARKIATALLDYNLPDKSQVALLSKNCAHWFMADLAIMMAGHVSVPIYPTLNADSIAQILDLSHSRAIIIGKLDDFGLQKPGISDIPIISVGLYGETEGDSWEDLQQKCRPLAEPYEQRTDDLTTLIYTSGTTGRPKGVMHSAGNFMKSAHTLISLVNLPENPRLFSYLPLSHIAERAGLEMRGMVLGAQIYFPESLATFARDLEAAQPHSFGAVPRIMAKFQEKILESLPQKKLDLLLKIPLVNNWIKKKLRKKLGLSDARIIVSGAAPMASSLIRWYRSIGIEINQMYGMTEDCIISHTNVPGADKIGTVGKPLPGVRTKLSPEGEIWLKNDCLMMGYFEAPETTKSVFTEDGFLKTGDIGEYDHDGYLTITGRVKDQFKTDKGKYIVPTPIELDLSKNNYIDQICVVGTGIPQPIALITPSVLAKAKTQEVLEFSLNEILVLVNSSLEKHEKIEKIVVMKEDWNVENGLITPTLKVKRDSIEKLHRPYYKSWFDRKEKVIFE
ncbi:AMP-binding protein [Flavobacteriaceae bacterium TP-CH-4]|uniref:AMP-binding protein n=1 Tax=Pelagihabitans pacificus TaxID=2696054 RepID=A0A967E6C1_9FLAO|nr:AMP-binding protein [Pelagihabitans pacificus]NHF59460.1 AMP-binding protein [Pelagihabitans pacificus]